MDRREFFKASATTLLFAGSPFSGFADDSVEVVQDNKLIRAKGSNYLFEWSEDSDLFRLSDQHGRLVTTGPLQPAVVVTAPADSGHRCSSGKVSSRELKHNRLAVTYNGVNQHAKVTVVWRFDAQNLWLEPIVYDTPEKEDVVSLHYFAKATGQTAVPALRQNFLIQPGISESTALSPIMPAWFSLNLTSWLGHGDSHGESQQWGLPVHFFCGASNLPGVNTKGSMKQALSDAFCCGLAELPAGDLLLEMKDGNCSPILNIRSDLWGHATGAGRMLLGSTFYWGLGRDYREAIRQYYLSLVRAGLIQKKVNTPRKNAVATAAAFDTWGAESAAGKTQAKFDEALLNSMYKGLQASGMRPGIFIIDQKWEGSYGLLQHSEERFPHFDAFLNQLRQDGYRLGMWAAFIRCEDPAAVGLNVGHMLRGADGQPIIKQEQNRNYYLYDFTQPDVEQVLGARVKRFVERYKPDLVKFDFGYELPSLSTGAPKNMDWAGERLLKKGADLIIQSMREVNPDLVVMYYSLSPLFIDSFDLHSPDDLCLCAEDYQIEANRRFFFSGLLGEIGMPTFSSTGYDWPSTGDIWFDAAPIGSIGSINAFDGDEQDAMPTPLRVAKYNGLSQIARTTNLFTVEALDPVLLGSVTGAHSSSWVRLENGEPVLVALKAQRFDRSSRPLEYGAIVKASTSVVMGSKSNVSLSRTRQLGIVPYGDGEALIVHEGTATVASVTTHCLGKPSRNSNLALREGILRVPLREQLEDGSVVEWLEIRLS